MPNATEILSQLLQQKQRAEAERAVAETAAKSERDALDREREQAEEQQGRLLADRRIAVLSEMGVMEELDSLKGVLEENGAKEVHISAPGNPYDPTAAELVGGRKKWFKSRENPSASLIWDKGEKWSQSMYGSGSTGMLRKYRVDIGVLLRDEDLMDERWMYHSFPNSGLNQKTMFNGARESGVIDRKGRVKNDCIFVAGEQAVFVEIQNGEETRDALFSSMANACVNPRICNELAY